MTVCSTPRIRLALWALVGGVATLIYRTLNGLSLDGPYFARAAHQLLHGAGLHVYADQGLQAGPWQLLWFALVGSGPAFAAASGALTAVGLVVALRSLRAWRGEDTRAALEAAVVALSVGWGIVSGTYAGGHPAELVIPATWALAAGAATRDRTVAAGLLIGFGAGWETWGLLGMPILLLLPSVRRVVAAGAVAVTAAVAVYLPFVIAGPFRMGEAQWPVNPHTLVFALAGGGQFTWSERLAQAVMVSVCGAVAAMLLRRRQVDAWRAVWLLPAILVLAKLVADPQPRDYYWVPLQALLLTGLAAATRRELRLVAPAVPVLVVALVMPLQVWPLEIAVLLTLIVSSAAGRFSLAALRSRRGLFVDRLVGLPDN